MIKAAASTRTPPAHIVHVVTARRGIPCHISHLILTLDAAVAPVHADDQRRICLVPEAGTVARVGRLKLPSPSPVVPIVPIARNDLRQMC